MFSWRLLVGLSLAVTGLVLAVMAFCDERYWACVGFVVAGISAAVSVFNWPEWGDPGFFVPAVLSAALTLFSIFDVFTSSHALNYDEVKAQADLLTKLISLDLDSSGLSNSEMDLVRKGIEICTTQNIRDTQQLAVDSQKAIRSGASATLADGVNSQLGEESTKRCLDYYRELRKTQPTLFCQLEEKYPWLLKKINNDSCK